MPMKSDTPRRSDVTDENEKPGEEHPIKLDMKSNLPPHIASEYSSITSIPFFECDDNRNLLNMWQENKQARYWKSDIWSSGCVSELQRQFELDEPLDSSGLPKRPLDPAFAKVWNNIRLKNPWTLIKFWGDYHSDKNDDAVIWLDGMGSPERTITWTDLTTKAFKLAIYLKETVDVSQGDRIMLCFPPGIDFIIAFLACLFGGYVAVPVYPPTPANQTRDGDRFLDIRKNAAVRIILTNKMYSRVARLMFRLWRGGDASDPEVKALGPPLWLPVEESEVVSDEAAENFTPCEVYPWTTAFLQFTSGSTSQPKGVVVTHGSLLHNVHICGKGFGMPNHLDDPSRVGEMDFDALELEEFIPYMRQRHAVSAYTQGHPARVFSWLPVYHDMGLIGGLMTPLFGGCQLYQMSPVDFIKKPDLWMQSISDYRCSCCAAPNFAFELAVKRTSDTQVRSMSLSHLAGIICGAEPIRPSTMHKFFTKFSQAGLRDDVIIPAFGLAENTLIVSCRDNAFDRPKVLALDAEEFRRNSAVIPVPYGAQNGGTSRPRTPSNTGPDYRGMIDLDVENAEWLSRNAYDHSDDTNVMTLVGCGKSAHQVDIRIVDHKSMHEVSEGVVGEVWFQSSSTARGYYRLKDKTMEDFYAGCIYLDGKQSPNIYMRSGDTGFLFKRELFICGRLKDMLVVRGKNYYPQDIECVLDTIPELRAGCSIAISTEDPANEELCVAAELRDNCFVRNWTGHSLLSTFIPALSPTRVIRSDVSEGFDTDEEFYAHLCAKMTKMVQAQVGITVSRVFLLKGRSMAKTTSGKVRRHAARTALLNESKRAAGLLYTAVVNHDELSPSKIPLEELKFRDQWPTDNEDDFLEALVTEMLRILIDTVPSTSLPRFELNMNAASVIADPKSRVTMKDFFHKAIFELGMDSPTMVEFGERIRRRIDPDFDVFNAELILHCPTIAHLVAYMSKKVRSEESNPIMLLNLDGQSGDASTGLVLSDEQIEQMECWAIKSIVENRDDIDSGEYQVDPIDDTKILCDRVQVSPAGCYPVAHHSEWTRVLLTGATGFLGQWQLRYLLEMFPRCEVSCIIRSDDVESAWARMALTVNGAYFESQRSRVELIPGDITKINFGMEGALYDALCAKVHVVFHTAANINLFTSYNRLRKTNVLATVRMIEFCSTVQLKPLNFASTLGLFPAYFALWREQYKGVVVEEGSRPNPNDMAGIFPPTGMGYPWTKLACERILERAHNQGLPVSVFRYPLTCMCYENGHTQTDNVMIPLMLAAIQEGIIPRNFVMNANTPSDVAAKYSVMVAMTGVLLPKMSDTWLTGKMNRFLNSIGASNGNDTEQAFDKNAVDVMPVLHMVDPRKVTGNKLSVWLSELGVPIDLVDDPLTLLEAAQVRGESSAIRDIIHLTRSPIAKYWFGARESLVGMKELPISTSNSRSKIAAAYFVHCGQPMRPDSMWPEPRELFKRCFLYMIKKNILTEISAGVVGQVFECGEEILQLNYDRNRTDACTSPAILSPNSREVDVSEFQEISRPALYSARGEAFAQAQSMTASVCQRAAQGLGGNQAENENHPLSTVGQLMMSMWSKYSGALAYDLMATPLLEAKKTSVVEDDRIDGEVPDNTGEPPVLVILSADRVASAALQTLLVEGTLTETFKAPNLRELLPASVPEGLAAEMLEVYEALGVLGRGNTSGAALIQAFKRNKKLSDSDFAKLAGAPADDTLLLELLPDDSTAPSIDCLLGLDNISFNDRWEMRYQYHKQFLSRRELYREDHVLVLSSPLHAIHLEELKECYPNVYIVVIESDTRQRWMKDGYEFCKIMQRTQMNVESYVDGWLTLHDEIDSAVKKVDRCDYVDHMISITAEQLTSEPLNCLNKILGLMRPELIGGNSKQLSVKPMLDMMMKYQSSNLVNRFLSSKVIMKQLCLDTLDFMFIGRDETGDDYFRGNRLIRYGLEVYTSVAGLVESASSFQAPRQLLTSLKSFLQF
eukprot:GHVH01013508.1.p1 GENE.GHVH01013508.1~~GHVH01013508.1.p1  ORF type:complete len:1977 (+),score=264.58 GHVH01013508.1:293-6223(+)